MKTAKTIAAWAFLTVVSVNAWAASQPWRVAPAPSWVKAAEDAPLAEAGQPVEQGDSDYLLVDHQIRLTAITTHYSRFVERLVNQASVDDGAQISVEIDPEHERVLLHAVRVFRAGRVLDKLTDARKSLLNREEELDEGLINGRVTLHVLLRDIRVGDILDYAYTVERKDPIGERGYHSWFTTQWTTPVRRFRLRVIRPADRPLQIKDDSQLSKPVESRQGAWVETVWDAQNLTELADESGRPSWFYYYPRIELSEFADWNAIRAWATPMYVLRGKPGAGMRELLADIRSEKDTDAQILKALRFVQDDIRYTGLEMGAGAYRPSQPDVVLARRYGDCKDKVLLLVALLRELGVEAYPALVNSERGQRLADRLPSPGAFDHVIARARFQDRNYWLDATASGQGGTLSTLVQADFGGALVLAPDADDLEQIPRRDGKTVASEVTETYDFRQGTHKPAAFTVRTVYREDDADSMRVRLRSRTAREIGKDYLDYYRKTYSGIRATKPLSIEDDRLDNVVTLHETYEIDEPFEKNDDGKRQFHLEAYLVSDRTSAPDLTVRNTPLARAFPLHVRHEIVAWLPGSWDIDADDVKIRNPAFEYVSSSRYRNGKLELAYELRNTADHVPVIKLKKFLTELDKAHDDAFYTLTDGEDVPAAAPGPAKAPSDEPPPPGASIEMIVALLAGLGAGALISWILATARWRLPDAVPGSPVGLSGWMVIPTLAVLASPFYSLYIIATWLRDLGAAAQFQAHAEFVQWALLLEFASVCVMLVVGIFASVLLFRRTRTFPFAFITLYGAAIAMLTFGLALSWLQGDDVETRGRAGTQLMGRVSAAVVWGAYMLMSERVRATFVMPWKKEPV